MIIIMTMVLIILMKISMLTGCSLSVCTYRLAITHMTQKYVIILEQRVSADLRRQKELRQRIY